jgi:hypothetical protein
MRLEPPKAQREKSCLTDHHRQLASEQLYPPRSCRSCSSAEDARPVLTYVAHFLHRVECSAGAVRVSMSRQRMIVGLRSGGVAKFGAPDGRPLTTRVRKAPIMNRPLDPVGFRSAASCEVRQLLRWVSEYARLRRPVPIELPAALHWEFGRPALPLGKSAPACSALVQ